MDVHNILVNNFNTYRNKSGFIYISLPSIDTIKNISKKINYDYTLESLKSLNSKLIRLLTNNRYQIKLCYEQDEKFSKNDLNYIYYDILDTIELRGTASDKSTYCRLYAIMTSSITNVISNVIFTSTDDDIKLFEKLYNDACVDANELRKKYNPHAYTAYSTYDLSYLSWSKADSILTTRMNCYYVDGVVNSAYRGSTRPFLCPSYPVVAAHLINKHQGKPKPYSLKKIPTTWSVCENIKNVTGLTSIKALGMAGQLTAGKTKVNKSTLKKITDLITFDPVPGISPRSIDDPISILAQLAIDAGMNSEDAIETIPGIWKKLYETLFSPSELLLSLYLNNFVKGAMNRFGNLATSESSPLVRSIQKTLLEMAVKNMSWCTIQSVKESIMYHFSLTGRDFIFPYSRDNGLGYVQYANQEGKYVVMTDYKPYIHEPIFNGFLITLGTLGMIDYLVDEKKEIQSIRVNELGRYALGLSEQFPLNVSEKSASDDIEYDDNTQILLIKNNDTPYISLVNTIAVKVTSTRYRITGTSLQSNCKSVADLTNKYSKFKEIMNIVDSPQLDQLYHDALKNYNVVTKTDNSSYVILNVDPSNRRLHDFLLTHEDIKNISFRVEGCRLAVKSEYIQQFLLLLESNGFPSAL